MLLLAGCGGSNEAEPASSNSAAASEAPSEETTTAAPAETVDKAELEARIAGLTDAAGDPFQVVPTDQAAAGMDAMKSALKDAVVEPAECKDQAAGSIAASGDAAADSVAGIGAADDAGGIMAAALIDGSAGDVAEQTFGANREVLEKCGSVTMEIAGTKVSSTTEEVPIDQIGEESIALLVTQELGAGQMFYTISVNARGNGLIASMQSMSSTKPDSAMQAELSERVAQLLEPTE